MSSQSLLRQPVALGVIWLVSALGAGLLILDGSLGLAGILGIAAGGCLTAITRLTASRTPGGKALASLVAVTAGALLIGALAIIVLGTGVAWRLVVQGGLLGACVFLGFGASAAASGPIDFSSTGRSSLLVLLTVLPPIVYGLAHVPTIVRHLDETAGEEPWFERASITDPIMSHVFAPDPGPQALAVFIFLFIGLAFSLSYVIPRLTILDLLQRSTQEAAADVLTLVQRWGHRIVLVVILVFSVFGIGGHFGTVETRSTFVYADELQMTSLLLQDIAASVGLRIFIIAILAFLWAGFALSVIPAIPRLRHNMVVQELPTLVGGVVVVLAIHLAYRPLYSRFIEPALLDRHPAEPIIELGAAGGVPSVGDITPILAPPIGRAMAAAGVTVLLLSVLALLIAISVLEAMEFISDGGDPGGVAGAAFVGGGLLLGISGSSLLVVGLLVLTGIIVWDITRYAEGVVTELGRTTVTVAPVLTHAVSTILLGLVFLVGIVLLSPRISAIDPAEFSTIVIGLFVLGALFAFAALKRRASRVSSRVG